MHHIFQTRVNIISRVVWLVIPGAGSNHARCDHGLLRWAIDFISSQLVRDELVVRHVAVQGLDNPVSIHVDVRLQLIPFIATGFRESDKVQPMPRPTLAVML